METNERGRPKREEHKQRAIQRKVDADDRTSKAKKPEGAMQAGARQYPEPPFPKQHHLKPGNEAHRTVANV